MNKVKWEKNSQRSKRPKLSWSGFKLVITATVTDEVNYTVK